MSRKSHGQVRRGQVITTYGPGALIDLPRHSAIVGGLETWPKTSDLEEIPELRLTRKLQIMTGVTAPRLFAPPPDENDPRETAKGIGVWRFPEWFIVQEASGSEERERSRRLVHRKELDDKGRFDGRPVVATRFVRACPKGHVDDLDWRRFVHGAEDPCRQRLWLDERGTGGDLADLVVRCECGKSPRSLYEATQLEMNPLGTCRGARPWLGRNAEEDCKLPSRLLIRTASNAYFPQVVSVLSLPDRGSAVETAVRKLWDDLQIVDDASDLAFLKKKPKIAERLAPFSDDEVLAAIREAKGGKAEEKPVKQVELEALLAAPEGFGDDVPIDPNFHARRLPDRAWRHSKRSDGIESVIQVHRLREVLALVGFTRFEAVTPDINGEYETDVERAQIALEPTWFPAVENRGEGLFVQLQRASSEELACATGREATPRCARATDTSTGRRTGRASAHFPVGRTCCCTRSRISSSNRSPCAAAIPLVLFESGYTQIPQAQQFGILLYTGSPDAEGTLGGLVQQARHIEDHLAHALRMSALCSNDPVCAYHVPGESLESRWLHGAACHGCALVAETSCEMRNDYLDRALVVPVLGVPRRCILRSRCMSDVLLDLPSHLRERLVSALESGLLGPSPTLASLRSVLGSREGCGRHRRVAGRTRAAWDLGAGRCRLASDCCTGCSRELGNPTLCGLGPKFQACTLGIPDVSTKSCSALQSARSGRAHTPFSTVPRRSRFWLDAWSTTPALRVTLLLNIQRKRGDTTASEQLVRRFADHFWKTDWPGSSRPSVFYDPRALDAGRSRWRSPCEGRCRRR